MHDLELRTRASYRQRTSISRRKPPSRARSSSTFSAPPARAARRSRPSTRGLLAQRDVAKGRARAPQGQDALAASISCADSHGEPYARRHRCRNPLCAPRQGRSEERDRYSFLRAREGEGKTSFRRRERGEGEEGGIVHYCGCCCDCCGRCRESDVSDAHLVTRHEAERERERDAPSDHDPRRPDRRRPAASGRARRRRRHHHRA